MATPEIITRIRSYGGWQWVYRHPSATLNCPMRFGLYVPPEETPARWLLYWLSGLTCTEENFITKAGAQRLAAQYGAIVVVPDTSPRGPDVADEPNRWDLGQGAGFYLNATEAPWADHYRMYDYVVEELPTVLAGLIPNFAELPTAIAGHSMGGLGALAIALRNPDRYRSVSAFAPIVNPSQVPWGQGAFRHYLGSDPAPWQAYDPTALVQTGPAIAACPPIWIDQGTADPFLGEQLQPEVFTQACRTRGYPLTLRMQPNYDHSYYFIATFLGDHFAHHRAHCGS